MFNNYMFDTGTFKKVMEDYLDDLKVNTVENSYYISDSQFKEISSLELEKKNELLGLFRPLPHKILQESPDDYILPILDNAGAAPENKMNSDIINICIKNNYTFVNSNRVFAETAWKYGAKVKSLREFLKEIGSDRYSELEP